ncbi:type II toxin-antitoxin system YafQ family toxin [Leuconostoc gasicomitatum]|uniref:type II toxin-antitoxin system YafQ family toxin n=1 Tax=Leuconostoc gasicomitatum TaxID=115778 RepID=UPI0007E1B9B4|nr:type II toxin-antitoxin system YafQ family toxin [Leuconostoc gasicomitatum]CUW17648.1 YafQ toxin protein [Leuconostoc gasicomitatum]
MYKVRQSNQFKKSVKRVVKQGKDLDKLFNIVDLILSGDPLPAHYKDRVLNGKKWHGIRELHIEPDWLLAYQIDNGELILLLVDTGSHSQMLGM